MTNTVPKRERGRRRACCGVWVLALLGLLPVIVYLGLLAAGGILIVGDPLKKSDVVVLLGGGEATRMEEAVRIYQEKYASLLILTETGEVDPQSGIAYSTLQKEQAMNLGVPEGGIDFTPKHGNNTYEEAVAVRDMLEKSPPVMSAIIVTDPFHTFRTRLIYREVFRDSKITVSIRPARGSWYRSTTWWQSREGWQLTISEYAKVFAYLMGVREGIKTDQAAQ